SQEPGLYAYAASFSGGYVNGAALIYRTVAIVSRYSAPVDGNREIVGGQDGAAWGQAPSGAWTMFGATGVVTLAAGQSLGITIETNVAGLVSPPSFLCRFGVWKIA
ncbi:MAG: hypothetical protein ABIQ18_06900, partial [Umezawaea sp.]